MFFSDTKPNFALGYAFKAGSAHQPLFLICDHASFEIDEEFADLGLDAAARRDHIAGDIGAARVTELLAHRFMASAIWGVQSRLVVDLNRDPQSPCVSPALTCGVAVPGNEGLTDQQRQSRLDRYFHPYHNQVQQQLDNRGPDTIVVAIHSFTPCMNGFDRPWHVGLLYKQRDPRIAHPLMQQLAAQGHVVGDNEPYSGELLNYTLDRHALARGLRHVSVEIRQDLIGDEAGCQAWAIHLGDALAKIL